MTTIRPTNVHVIQDFDDFYIASDEDTVFAFLKVDPPPDFYQNGSKGEEESHAEAANIVDGKPVLPNGTSKSSTSTREENGLITDETVTEEVSYIMGEVRKVNETPEPGDESDDLVAESPVIPDEVAAIIFGHKGEESEGHADDEEEEEEGIEE